MTVVPVGMAAAGVRGRAGGGAKSRVRSRRCFTAAGPASSPQQSANAQASDDGGEGGINMNTGPDTDRGSHPSGDDGGKARGSGSSSSCRRSEWRQLVMQQQLDAIKVSHLATRHKMVTILFSDCVGFTAMCKKVPPLTVMHFLNELYQKLDALLDIYKVYKVETIGDCYVVAGGLVRLGSDSGPTHNSRRIAVAVSSPSFSVVPLTDTTLTATVRCFPRVRWTSCMRCG
ncbi:hypothetical protein Vretimale_11617 [Volvox reticuliferus]|nr:hypothetical protein Vretimale_11617 [Volvox reticuliferus]